MRELEFTLARAPTVCPRFTLTAHQICDLPPGTISDIVNEHNLTVHWTEKHTHRDCALYTGRPCVTLQVAALIDCFDT